jgi:hypothetical protein
MKAVAVFTNRGLDMLVAEGGTQAWKLNPKRVARRRYVVCTQNRNADWGQPTHEHGQGFLIGKISSVDRSSEPGCENRYIIRFSEYAEINVPEMAKYWRNPVRYIDLDEHGIDPAKLKFKKVSSAKAETANPRAEEQRLNMAEAKKALAAFYKIPSSSIEIMIRG